MEIKLETTMGIHIMHFDGELDMGTTDRLEKAMEEILSAEFLKGVIFNFTHLSFVDSTGVGKLLNFFHKLMNRDLPFYLVGLTPDVEDVFDILGLPLVIGQERFRYQLEEAVATILAA
ncbi:STAS domain-containing protein [Aneurinibacillus sp. UBA3580]|jgi:anti-anti-sigma factor|uniref:STAS domain-containing protein n=1 Tax=Aneurinibacillus sp. UBA3580 TaxID=1946041 RepID=UPI00257AFEDA|nr:STAS domain-containing protein [Aneurinibacillus sp. UBA3580]